MRRLLPALLFCLVTAGCSSLSPVKKPVVNVTGFQILPANQLAPRFAIDMNVMNPNSIPLRLRGISYSIAVEGHPLLRGVSNQLPQIPAYGEASITLNATADLFSGMKLIADLLQSQKDEFEYEITANLDAGNLLPTIPVTEKGHFSLPKQ